MPLIPSVVYRIPLPFPTNFSYTPPKSSLSMSTEEKVSLGGYNIKDWSLIFLIGALAAVFIVFAIGAAYALVNNPEITIAGTIDLSQFTGIIIGIAMVAVVLVGQQLTAKQQATAVEATDKVWLASEK